MHERKLHSFVDILCSHAEIRPYDIAYRFFPHGLSQPTTVSYRELWTEAAALAHLFVSLGLQGQRIILATTSNRSFVTSFYACLMAGATATPAPPSGRKRQAERLRLLIADSQARAVVGDEDEVASQIELTSIIKIDYRNAISDTDKFDRAQLWRRPSIGENSLALLQYTSGSTGDPKGVMVSHRNLMANSACIQRAMNIDERSSLVTSLPLFHDMGLVGAMLQPMFSGCQSSLLTPVQFIQHPEWWLQLISSLRITHSGGPNFMFDLAANTIPNDQLEDVDLSSWEIAWCGAEPIRAATIDKFIQRFKNYGFKSTSFFPCYGMAESTLFVTSHLAGALSKLDDTRGAIPVVGCGFPRMETTVAIVDPETKQKMADGIEGEVWVRGDSVAVGYWNRPDLSAKVFQAFVDGTDDGPYLRTGDIGFRKEGELYITGRIKDIIIIRGKKYAPQDIEQVAGQSCDSILPDGCIAFGIEQNGVESLVVVAELRRGAARRSEEHKRICRAIGDAIFSAFQLSLGEVVLVIPHSIPRTSSGKLKRAQSRSDYVQNRLARIPVPSKNVG